MVDIGSRHLLVKLKNLKIAATSYFGIYLSVSHILHSTRAICSEDDRIRALRKPLENCFTFWWRCQLRWQSHWYARIYGHWKSKICCTSAHTHTHKSITIGSRKKMTNNFALQIGIVLFAAQPLRNSRSAAGMCAQIAHELNFNMELQFGLECV